MVWDLLELFCTIILTIKEKVKNIFSNIKITIQFSLNGTMLRKVSHEKEKKIIKLLKDKSYLNKQR